MSNLDTLAKPPLDYKINIDEDFHFNGIITTILLGDVFTPGPTFDVQIFKGLPRSEIIHPAVFVT